MEKICIVSLGCDKNTVDAECMAKLLADAGYELCDTLATADCVLINTCGFIESAKKEAIDAIFAALRERDDPNTPLRAVLVSGCLVQRYGEEFKKELPELDGALGLCGNADIVAAVRAALSGKKHFVFGEPEQLCIGAPRLVSTPRHFAYIKIAEGCDNRCTYCAIPAIRGRFRSRPVADIVAEAQTLADAGVKELILTAQDTTAYGRDLGDGSDLAGLLEKLCRIEGIVWLRVLYAYPERVDERLIDVMAREEKIVKYLDIPLQHIDDTVLRRMGRHTNGAQIKQLIATLRRRIPGIVLRSTFIVGFPGESEAQFESLYKFLEQVGLERAGCFAFSCEDGTPAEKLDGQLDDETKNRRQEQLSMLFAKQLDGRLQACVGTAVCALCDGFDAARGLWVLRTAADAPDVDSVVLCAGKLETGRFYKLNIISAEGGELFGEIIG